MENENKLAYLLGALKDGAVYKNEKEKIYRIRIYQKSKEWLEMVQQIFLDVFETKMFLRKDPRKDLWYAEINNKKIFSELENLVNTPVPEFVKTGGTALKKSFLQGVFDSEGGILRIEKYENNPELLKKKLSDIRVRFGQSNFELLQFIKDVLREIQITTGKISGPFFKNERSQGYFELNSYGLENLKRFSTLIGSRHPTKLMRIEKILSEKA